MKQDEALVLSLTAGESKMNAWKKYPAKEMVEEERNLHWGEMTLQGIQIAESLSLNSCRYILKISNLNCLSRLEFVGRQDISKLS